jgi:prephenate dehydratase
MRVGYLGPPGTFSHEALLTWLESAVGAGGAEGDISRAGPTEVEQIPLATLHETVRAVQDALVDVALAPIESSLGGAVTETLDTLVEEAPDVVLLGELVLPVHQALIARREVALDQITVVVSHLQAKLQCSEFLRRELPQAIVQTVDSTAEAVRLVAGADGETLAALGTTKAAERYGCVVLRTAVEDVANNETRFVWLARDPSIVLPARGAAVETTRWKTSLVFWGAGAERPGWLVGCLNEFAERAINLTRIESRPARIGLGQYRFFVDLEGARSQTPIAAAIADLERHCQVVRVLGSYPSA